MTSTLVYLAFGMLGLALWSTTKGGQYKLAFGFFGRIGLVCLLVVVGFFAPFQPMTWLLFLFLVAVEMVAYMTKGAVAMAANVVAFIVIFSLIMTVVRGI